MSDTSRVREHYDAHPYTGGLPALPGHWLDAGVDTPPLRDGARVLVAGCGTGAEVAAYASVPGLSVVGVDLSPRSIALAEAQAYPGEPVFAVADLAKDDLVGRFGQFDFICCHAVADYVPDTPGLFQALAAALAPNGVLYVGTNTDHHPGARIRSAFQALGLGQRWQEDGLHRAGLRAVSALLGPDAQISGLASRPEALLGADVFPPFAHGMGLPDWEAAAGLSGLRLVDTLATLHALPAVGDGDLPLLYGLDRAAIARLITGLRREAVLQALFASQPKTDPPFTEPAALFRWRATLHPAVGALPPLQGDWMAPRFLALQPTGLPELRLQLSAWMLELYRRCDGRPLDVVRASMSASAHDAHLQASVFRFWHAGLLRLDPPVT